jgi:streptogramin lyase
MTSRWSNAVTVSSDGSVWFGEQAVPGVAHLLLNGTLVEYPWPTAREPRTGCGYRTGIWGIQVWNGLVWAADSDENALVGVDPATGGATVVNVTGDAPQPYTLAASPDGSLWFTTLSQNAVLGRLMPNLTAVAYQVNGLGGEVPLQVEFVNSSYAYFVALNPIRPYGHLYAFDPEVSGRSITPVRVGGAFQILDPSSVSATGGHVWVTQHGASDLAEFDVKSGNWTVFPTSTENFTTTTLPYFVYAGGQEVWFNEHYANRIAVLNASAGTLTEFSEADPPIENGSLIQNDLTIAPGDGGLWFTSITGNYVGFVNGSVRIPLSISVRGADSIALAPGQTAKMDFLVGGVGRDGAKVGTSDSEAYDSVPNLITMAPSMTVIPPSSGPQALQVAVTPRVGTAPGTYTMAVSVSDGLVIQTAYFFLRVS